MLGPLGALFASTGEVPPLTLFDSTPSVEERLWGKQCEEWHLCRRRITALLKGGTPHAEARRETTLASRIQHLASSIQHLASGVLPGDMVYRRV